MRIAGLASWRSTLQSNLPLLMRKSTKIRKKFHRTHPSSSSIHARATRQQCSEKHFWRSLQKSVVSVCFWGNIICWHWKLPCLFEREDQCKVLDDQCQRIDNDVCLLSLREDWAFCKVWIEHLFQRRIIAIPWIDSIDDIALIKPISNRECPEAGNSGSVCYRYSLSLSGSEYKNATCWQTKFTEYHQHFLQREKRE